MVSQNHEYDTSEDFGFKPVRNFTVSDMCGSDANRTALTLKFVYGSSTNTLSTSLYAGIIGFRGFQEHQMPAVETLFTSPLYLKPKNAGTICLKDLIFLPLLLRVRTQI